MGGRLLCYGVVERREVKEKGFGYRVLPSWCPPGPVFAVVWTTLSLLRAAAGTLVFQQAGALCCAPIIAFVTHLVRTSQTHPPPPPPNMAVINIYKYGCHDNGWHRTMALAAGDQV